LPRDASSERLGIGAICSIRAAARNNPQKTTEININLAPNARGERPDT